MEPRGIIMLIQVETELIHTIDGLVCLLEFPEIQLALSTKVVVIFVGSIGLRFQGRIYLDVKVGKTRVLSDPHGRSALHGFKVYSIRV
jgi:hypothetical protein